jgi:diguanylate cyclase (GGDEF)-like protein/PAS domain S-box-containing protein
MGISRRQRGQRKMENTLTEGSGATSIDFGLPVAASIHSSLQLEVILRNCRNSLGGILRISRISLVQYRDSEDTVTLYSLNGSADSTMMGPRVIELQDSRLKQSLSEQKEIASTFIYPEIKDGVETSYLLGAADLAVLYLPLRWKTKPKGILVLSLQEAPRLDTAEKSFVLQLRDQMALAIENSDIHYMERRQDRQLEMISEIAKQAVMLEELDEFLRRASELLRNGFDYDVVQIWTVAGAQDALSLRTSARKPSREDPVQSVPPPVRECLTQNRALRNNNLRSGTDGGATDDGSIASHMAVPIRLRGKLLGVLWFQSARLDAFPREDVDTMEGIASLIASAFDNLRTFEHVQQSKEYMQAILQSAKDLAIISTDLNGYVITVSLGCESIFHHPQQQILGRDVVTLFSSQRFQQELAAFLSEPNTCMMERSRLIQTAGKGHAYLDIMLQRVYSVDNHPIGFLCVCRDVTDTVLMQQRLEALSVTDDLTGLYNQRRFYAALASEIERSRRFNRTFSLCFIDLDGLKQYNDRRGHVRGDRALRETASLLRTLIRANVDSCFRYGGDEFTIIMPETTRIEAQAVIERILTRVSERFGGEITLSGGIVEFSPTMQPEELIEKADLAMYKAKSEGGNRVVLAD